jgi:hypothetical protein
MIGIIMATKAVMEPKVSFGQVGMIIGLDIKLD